MIDKLASLMKMTEKQREKWSKTRKKGRTRFIWLYGVVGWGVVTGVLWAAAMAFQGLGHLPLLLPLALIVFPIGGFFFGRKMWTTFEDQFQEAALREKPDVGPDRSRT
jgi:hypothetical protein